MAMPAIFPAMNALETRSPDQHDSAGGTMVSTDGRTLALRATTLRAEARGGLCRVVVEQRFVNPHAEPLAVSYQLPMPADAAVSGFAFTVAGRRVRGEVDRKHAARERFEAALLEGRTAALLEQVRSSVFQQEVGNIPPGAELVAEVTVDQRLAWLDEGAWEWRFPSVVGARYVGDAGRVEDAAKLSVEVADRPLPARLHVALTVADALAAGRAPESPSHALSVDSTPEGRSHRVSFRHDAGVRLDRDVVVRWAVAKPEVGLALAAARPAADRPHGERAYGLLTIVPPVRSAAETVARDLTVLIDTSGSMGGRPLEQASRVVAAMIATLTERDRIELIEFASTPRRWKPEPVAATKEQRAAAIAWVRSLRAGGGTEMRTALSEALRPLRPDSQRQVVLVTDGYIGFEHEIVREVYEKLPAGARLHAIGVGSAVNRSLTQPAARAGRGLEVVIGIDEDPEPAARRMVARTDAPVLTDVTVSGSAVLAVAPAKMPDLFAQSPVLVGLELRPEGGEVIVRGRAARGAWERRMRVAPTEPGAGAGAGETRVCALFAREAVEDLETARAAGALGAGDADREIERIGLAFQVATRMTSWVAVSEEKTVDPGAPYRKETMPQDLPHGVSIEGLGLRAASAGPAGNVALASGLAPPAFLAQAAVPAQQAFGAPMNLPAPGAPPPSPAMYPQSVPSLGDAPFEAERVYSPAPPKAEKARRAVASGRSSVVDTGSIAAQPLARKRSAGAMTVTLVALALLVALAVALYLLGRAPSPAEGPTPMPSSAPARTAPPARATPGA